MKKIALCLFGNFNNRLSATSGLDGFNYIKENILKNRDVDVFIHSWDLDNQATIEKCYAPNIKKSIFQKQIDFKPLVDAANIQREVFNPPGGQVFRTIENTFSFLYTRGKSIELKKEFEQENNFKYDVVICCRFDLAQMDKYNGYQDFKVSEIVFNENLDMNYIYAAMWDQFNLGFTDMWYYSSSENMNILCSFFEKAKKYYQLDSDYIKALTTGWPDSNREDLFSNEMLKEEKSHNLMKFTPAEGHNNHFMHKWFFIDTGLYQKTKFLAVYSGLFCSVLKTHTDQALHWPKYFKANKKYSRVIGPKFVLIDKKSSDIPADYQQIICTDLLSGIEQIKTLGFKACLIETEKAVLKKTIDYYQLKSAMKFVMRNRYGMPLRNGFDCIQLGKPSFSLGIRTISDKHIYWSPPFIGHLEPSLPTLWKIDSLIDILKTGKLFRPASYKCGFIYEKDASGSNKIYPI